MFHPLLSRSLGKPFYWLFRPRAPACVDANTLFVIYDASSHFMLSVSVKLLLHKKERNGRNSFFWCFVCCNYCFQRGFSIRMEAAPAPWPPASRPTLGARQLWMKKAGVVKMIGLKAPSSTLCYIWTPVFSFRFLHVPCFAFNFLFLSPLIYSCMLSWSLHVAAFCLLDSNQLPVPRYKKVSS